MNFEADLDETMRQLIPTPALQASPMSKVKRPPNAYNLYFLERQPKLKAEHPLIGGNEISKLIGAEWKDMSEEAKKPYYDEAKKIHDDFKREHPNWHYDKSQMKQSKKKGKNYSNNYIENFPQVNPNFGDPNSSAILLLGGNLLAQFILSRQELISEVQQFVKNYPLYKTPTLVDDPQYTIPQ